MRDLARNPIFKRKPFGQNRLNQEGLTRKNAITGLLQDRLRETLILELHEDGNKKYVNMTLRELYAHVMRVIARRYHDENDEIAIDSPITNIVSSLPSKNTTFPKTPTEIDHHSNYRIPKKNHKSGIKLNKSNLRRHISAPVNPVITTYRERLGGYLHPRDMRRLVTPFSSSNAPELMVRRHVILFNFDPLRAIVLRDRVLIFVPDGADSMLNELEKRVFGGIQELENQVFGDMILRKIESTHDSQNNDYLYQNKKDEKRKFLQWKQKNLDFDQSTYSQTSTEDNYTNEDDNETDMTDDNDAYNQEWNDIENRNWIDMAFDLHAVDAVLQTVCSMLSEDALVIVQDAKETMAMLGGEVRSNVPIHTLQERLKIKKDEIKETEARVQGFVRAINLVLDEDEDLALMNLSRLVTHPERFIQPVPEEIIHEESDEPELILEAYMQQALSISNALQLLQGKINSMEELVMMKLDTVRNRLLLINTMVSLISLCVAAASLVGSIFGMNLINGFEESDGVFSKVVLGTMIGSAGMLVLFSYAFHRAGSITVGV